MRIALPIPRRTSAPVLTGRRRCGTSAADGGLAGSSAGSGADGVSGADASTTLMPGSEAGCRTGCPDFVPSFRRASAVLGQAGRRRRLDRGGLRLWLGALAVAVRGCRLAAKEAPLGL